MRLRPQDATGNNALGAALVAAGHPDQGAGYLQAALRSRPDYFDAHYNLGIASGSGKMTSPERRNSFKPALTVAAQDATVEANLGAALAEMGRYARSEVALRACIAARSEPAHRERESRSAEKGNEPGRERDLYKVVRKQNMNMLRTLVSREWLCSWRRHCCFVHWDVAQEHRASRRPVCTREDRASGIRRSAQADAAGQGR